MATALVVKTPFLNYTIGDEITDIGQVQFVTSIADYFQFYVVIGDPISIIPGGQTDIRLLSTNGLVSPDHITTSITSDNVLHAFAGGSPVTINGVTKTVAEWLAYLLGGNVITPPTSTTNHILNRTPGLVTMRDGSILSHRTVVSTNTEHILNRSGGLVTLRDGRTLAHRGAPSVSTTTNRVLNRTGGQITLRNGSILVHRAIGSGHILNRTNGQITTRDQSVLSHV